MVIRTGTSADRLNTVGINGRVKEVLPSLTRGKMRVLIQHQTVGSMISGEVNIHLHGCRQGHPFHLRGIYVRTILPDIRGWMKCIRK